MKSKEGNRADVLEVGVVGARDLTDLGNWYGCTYPLPPSPQW